MLEIIAHITYAFFMKTVVLSAGHFLGDFAFQSTWMAMEKGKDWEVLFYHVAMYTSIIGVCGLTEVVSVHPGALVVIFLSHALIDALKARWGIIGKIYIDQLLHAVVLVFLVAIGWL